MKPFTTLAILAICTLTLAAADLPDPPKSPAARSAQRRYDAAIALARQQYKQSLIAADKTCLDDLQAAWKSAALARDTAELQRINAAKAAAQARLDEHQLIDSSNAATASISGKWKIRYASGSVRHYVIEPAGKVRFTDEDKTGNLVNGILDFYDGRVERITPAGDRLLVEHFNPKDSFPDGTPLLGIAEKEE